MDNLIKLDIGYIEEHELWMGPVYVDKDISIEEDEICGSHIANQFNLLNKEMRDCVYFANPTFGEADIINYFCSKYGYYMLIDVTTKDGVDYRDIYVFKYIHQAMVILNIIEREGGADSFLNKYLQDRLLGLSEEYSNDYFTRKNYCKAFIECNGLEELINKKEARDDD